MGCRLGTGLGVLAMQKRTDALQINQSVTSIDDLPPKIEGPSAWLGSELAQKNNWLELLSSAEINEIGEAARKALEASGGNIAKITPAIFPLPTFSKRLSNIERDIMYGRGFALLRGLPVDEWGTEISAAAFYGLGSHLGPARSQNAKGHILGHVRDLGRDPDDPNARIYQTTARQTFHTDSTDIVGLLCLKTAKSGGESMLVSAMTIYNRMREEAPELALELFQPNAIDRRGEVPIGMKGYYMLPPLTWHEENITIHYQRRYIDSAQRFEDAPRLSQQRIQALDMFDRLANDPDLKLDMEFHPGDVQLVHNHTLLHDRLGFEDWPENSKRRHLLRLWLASKNGRPLPEPFAQRFGSVTIGDRGGVITPNTIALNAPLEAI
jgi:hypothetical protein